MMIHSKTFLAENFFERENPGVNEGDRSLIESLNKEESGDVKCPCEVC